YNKKGDSKRSFSIFGYEKETYYNFGVKRFYDLRRWPYEWDGAFQIADELKKEQPFPPNHDYECFWERALLGFEAWPNCWPWFATIQKRDKYHPMGWLNFCGGSLLNDGWVLTAAHCFVRKKSDDLRIVLGKHDLTKIEEGEVAYNISMIKAHNKNDIALVKLDGYNPNVTSGKIQPAKLPDKNLKKGLIDHLSNQGTFIAIGFGAITKFLSGRQSNVLREIELRSQPLGQCRSTFTDK
ncbi:unnamed protein product, partial [Owenia fusiformis]